MTPSGKFHDYVENPSESAKHEHGHKTAPRLEEGTVIDKPCFVCDVDGDRWFIDPEAQIIKRVD